MTEHGNPADALGAFVAATEYDALPDEAVRAAERAFVDTVGVTLAGAVDGSSGVRAARAVERLAGGDGPAPLVTGGTAPVHDAAFANATAGHYLDYDDVATAIHVHPSVPMVAPILAVCGHEGLPGSAALTAYAVGLEAQYFVAAPVNPEHYERGWHATATWGTFGATAAVASLLDLDAEAAAHAFNIAGSMAAGLKRNFGSMTKSMHAGQAARNGVLAASLADEGFTATADALVGDDGFYALHRGDADPDLAATPTLGDPWKVTDPGLDVKKYPCCYFTHAPIECVASLSDEHDLAPDDVASIRVAASQAAKDTVVYGTPETGLEAKFSMYFTVAAAVARDRVALDTFTADGIRDPATRGLLDRVEFTVDPDLPYGSHGGGVTIELADGTELERFLPDPPGSPANPLSDDELQEKFRLCAGRVLDDAAIDRLHDTLDDLRTVTDVAGVLDPVASRAATR